MKTLFKFLRSDLKSQNGDCKWRIGEWKHEKNLDMCNSGLHASKTPLQALGYVQGEILAEVEVKGKSIKEDDKQCWSDMRIVKAYHWKKEDSVALSIFAAELVIKNYEKVYPDDKRPRNAIEAAKKWLANPIEKNQSATWSAAWSAWSATWSTRSAESATWSARSAESAAWSATRSAESATWSATWSARSAAWSAWSARSAESAYKKLTASIDKWFIKRIKTLEPYV